MQKKTSKKENKVRAILYGLIAGLALSIVLLLVYSIIIEKGIGEPQNSYAIVCGINVLASFVGGAVAARKFEGGYVYCGLITGSIFGAIMLISSMLLSENIIELSQIFRILLCCIPPAMIGSVCRLCKSNKKFHKSGSKKKR